MCYKKTICYNDYYVTIPVETPDIGDDDSCPAERHVLDPLLVELSMHHRDNDAIVHVLARQFRSLGHDHHSVVGVKVDRLARLAAIDLNIQPLA